MPEHASWRYRAETEQKHLTSSAEQEREDDERLAVNSDISRMAEQAFARIREGVTLTREDVSSAAIYAFLKERGLDAPRFAVLDADAAREWLAAHGLDRDAMCQPDVIAVFDFPPPVAEFWKKDLREEGDTGMTAWGTFYEERVRRVWDWLDDMAELGRGNGSADSVEEEPRTAELRERVGAPLADFIAKYGWGGRLNNYGQHDPRRYYYVWGWYTDAYTKNNAARAV